MVDLVYSEVAEFLKDEQQAARRQMRFDTLAVHGMYCVQEALDNQGSIVEPAFLSTAQAFESSDHMELALAYEMPAWIYTRVANPTVFYLEQTLALLEGYDFEGEVSACVTGSGMSAIHMATNPFLANYGDDGRINIVVSAKCYGGTFQLFNVRYLEERGIEVRWVRNGCDREEWASKIDGCTRFVFGEMPSNPGLGVFDIEGVADMAHYYGAPLIVDATIATPALMRPLRHNADIVVHSVSKAMSSSGFAIMGAIVARHDIVSRVGPDDMRENFATYVKTLPFRDFGPAISPFNALMTLNDLRTLRPRIAQMSHSALTVARFLESHPAIEQVSYPGLASFAGHDLARKYMRLVDTEDRNAYSHLMSFMVRGGHAATRQFFDELRLIFRATDLGRVKSVATIPTISTHQQQGEAGRKLADIPPNLVRLSIGCEHPRDLMADLEQALDVGLVMALARERRVYISMRFAV